MSQWFEGLFHEKQIGSLCAVHCINNLCQRSAFDEIQLSEIAAGLDADECAVLGGSHLEGHSANVRADGFFSVQVITQALRLVGLSCMPIGSGDAQGALRNPQNEKAFIFNRQEHWYSVRKLGEYWFVTFPSPPPPLFLAQIAFKFSAESFSANRFDLNSMQSKPALISDLYLQMYIEQVVAQGFSVFVVRGRFQQTEIEKIPAKLRAAANACKATTLPSKGPNETSTEPTFKAFGGKSRSLAAPAPAVEIDASVLAAAENDPELAAAIAASLSETTCVPKKELTPEEQRAEMRAKRLAALEGGR
jgi:ataxin-3